MSLEKAIKRTVSPALSTMTDQNLVRAAAKALSEGRPMIFCQAHNMNLRWEDGHNCVKGAFAGGCDLVDGRFVADGWET